MGERINAFRCAANESIQVAATRAGISMQTWRNAEKFDLASPGTISAIAVGLGVPVESIMGSTTEDERQ